MCRSAAEGGQRCAAHIRPRFEACVIGTRSWDAAAADYATTKAGRAELRRIMAAADTAGNVEASVAAATALARGAKANV